MKTQEMLFFLVLVLKQHWSFPKVHGLLTFIFRFLGYSLSRLAEFDFTLIFVKIYEMSMWKNDHLHLKCFPLQTKFICFIWIFTLLSKLCNRIHTFYSFFRKPREELSWNISFSYKSTGWRELVIGHLCCSSWVLPSPQHGAITSQCDHVRGDGSMTGREVEGDQVIGDISQKAFMPVERSGFFHSLWHPVTLCALWLSVTLCALWLPVILCALWLPGCSRTYYVDHTSLEFIVMPASASHWS